MISVEMSSDGATIDQKSEHLIASKRTPSKSLIKRSANHTDEWESLMAAISSGNKDLQLETSPASQKLMEQVEGLRQRISTSQTAPIETLRWAEQMGTHVSSHALSS